MDRRKSFDPALIIRNDRIEPWSAANMISEIQIL